MESFGTWILNFLNTYVVGFGINLIFALIILLVGFKLVKVLITLVQKAKWYQKLDVNVQSFCGNFFSVLLKILIIIVVVDIIGVPSASLIAVLGSAGVAIGLALQGGLSNIAGGVIIMFCRPFHVGDFIITGAGSGVVQDIGIYYTKITTPDNQDIVLPNSTLTSSPITNLSTQETRRLDFDFSVAYSTDIDLARKVLLAAAQNNDLVLKDPTPEVFVAAHGESALTIKLRVWCNSADYWTVHFDMFEDVKKAFDQFAIEIPLPQVTVHMAEEKE
ncbi:MAG: mechanosensitive ion channel [Ruminococcaceae bacterium]|nr:mechanosensitive ion channel [Oscillospiraceae bacterium]